MRALTAEELKLRICAECGSQLDHYGRCRRVGCKLELNRQQEDLTKKEKSTGK
jgi:phage protein U